MVVGGAGALFPLLLNELSYSLTALEESTPRQCCVVQSGNPSEAPMTKSPRQTGLCLHSISEGQRVVVYN